MNKQTSNKHQFKQNDLFNITIALTVLSFIVSWGVEVLAKTLFRLG
jgi:hypothetical protein